MVAPNTQVSPLKHHSKDLNTLTSFRNYSRIQSEVQREGSEVHKENLLSLSLSKNGKHFGAGEKSDTIAPSGSQAGHLRVQGTSAKTGLPSVLSMEMVTFSHGLNAQEHAHHTDLRVSQGINRLVASGTAENTSRVSAFSSSAALQSPLLGEEAINAYNLYAEMFPRACTPMSTCTPTSDTHGEQEFCPSKPMIAEHVEVVQLLPDAKSVEDDQEDNVKRLKYTATMEDTSIGLFDMQNSKQGNASCCGVDGSSMSAARDGARQAVTGEVCTYKCAYKSNNCVVTKPTPQHSPGFMSWISSINAYAGCGTSRTAELSNAPPAVGLKLFTSSAHVQMPKAMLTFSEGEPSLPLSLEQQASSRLQKTPMHENSCTDADWGKFLALSATPPVANDMETASARVLPFQQRFKQLQAFLKQCDETNQNECMQALRSLSAAARSGHAVELETRAIRLSLEEGKEIKRMRLLNVLGKISERSLDAGATPHGPRLPAPGATAKLKTVP